MWWFDAEIECYEPLWQKAAIAAVAILAPLPFLCVFILRRWETETGLNNWQRELRRVLSNGFVEKRRWWLGVSLLRRLLLVVSFTMIQDQTWKSVASSVLCVCE